MQLTLREAAGYLGVTDAVLRRWITDRDLPVHQADERVYLNAVELWEWAVEHGVQVSRRLLEHARRAPDPVPPISELLRAGGIFHDVAADDKLGVLREFVARLPLPPEQNRDALLSVLEAREAMDPLADFFANCCRFAVGLWIGAEELRGELEQWAREQGIEPPSARIVGSRLRARGCESARIDHGRRRIWRGIGLTNEVTQ